MRNHYDFLFFIISLCLYSENYDKSAFSRIMKFCHCLICTLYHTACLLVFWGVYPGCRLFSIDSLCGAHPTAVALDWMAWKPLLRQWIGMVLFPRRVLNFVGMMCFTYAEDHLFRTMFPDREVVKKCGCGQDLEKSVFQMPDTCGFCLRNSE